MKATELRIGNWVFSEETESNFVIDEHSFSAISVEHIDAIKPIPLTEEWLKRFDWENRKDKDLAVSFGLTSGTIHFVAGNYYTKCDMVHHFQNLYFALTGEELNQNKEDESNRIKNR